MERQQHRSSENALLEHSSDRTMEIYFEALYDPPS